MGSVGIADFKAGALTTQATGTHRTQATLVGEFAERVDLVHELTQLGAGKEFAHGGHNRPGVDQLPGGNSLDFTHAHAVFGVALHAQQADAELALDELTDQFDATVSQGVDIVGWFLGIIKTNNFGDDGFDVFEAHDAVLGRVRDIEVQALVELVAADAAEVEALEVVEHVFDQVTGVIDGSQITGAEATVDFDQGVVLTTSRVFFEGNFDMRDLAAIDVFEGFAQASFVHAEGAEQGRDRHFALAVDLDVESAVGGRLKF